MRLSDRIAVVGGGPVGGYAAYLLSDKGFSVDIYEEHKALGLPVHCTGIVTPKFSKVLKVPESIIVNKIDRTRIYAPSGEYLDIKLNPNLILDRAKLDEYLVKKAVRSGARLHLSSKFRAIANQGIVVEDTLSGKQVEAHADVIVGADGPLSPVGMEAGLLQGRKHFIGVQARARLKNDNAVEFYPFSGGFAWIVPEERGIVRIGLVARDRPNDRLREFLENKMGEEYKKKVLEYQGGLIPLYNPKQITHQGKIYLVGDAAGMVKATTGGGLVQGLLGAEALASSFSTGKDYDMLWKKSIGKELMLALQARKLMDSFKENDYDLLVKLMNKERMRHILGSYDRDSLGSLLPRLMVEAIREPRFFKFVPHIKALI